MGACASSLIKRKGGQLCWQTTINIIHLDGRLQQFKQPMKAGHALSQNPNCFLCALQLRVYVHCLTIASCES
ncbi:hypothetical protein E2542_SST30276 [Spatholobus suberectus]|nr:hypothetical protein E2542_SST30655 [Spatholobus suberectus]TKY45715.1 hypothetical protein E2542_SST30276 [Spatholobus suberectus]